jgi:hypothetical protein
LLALTLGRFISQSRVLTLAVAIAIAALGSAPPVGPMHILVVMGPVAMEHGSHQPDGNAAGKQDAENGCDGSMEAEVIE